MPDCWGLGKKEGNGYVGATQWNFQGDGTILHIAAVVANFSHFQKKNLQLGKLGEDQNESGGAGLEFEITK